MNTYDLHGRTALVTGGAQGIGQAICTRFHAAGAKVASLDLRASAAADHSVVGSVTSWDDVQRAVAETNEKLGRVDVLVCAAGIVGQAAPTVDVTDEQWNRVLDVNAAGTHRSIRAVVPGMVAAGYGRIVTIASISALEGMVEGDAYSASKAAVLSITRTAGRSLATSGVLVNCVIPALTETSMVADLSDSQRAHGAATIPMGRLGRAEEVATMVTFLASGDLTFSTGAVFDSTGGRANY